LRTLSPLCSQLRLEMPSAKSRERNASNAGNLIDRDALRPVDDRRVHPLLRVSHSRPRCESERRPACSRTLG
jgi:hypothetical protein